jgi:long-chain fatty acid transport protein
MSNTARRTAAALLATGFFAFSGAAMATNGYFTHGVGTESKGMGGAGVASPVGNGPIAVATNPALGVFADDKWQVGMAIFSPMRSYTARDSLSGGFGGAFALSAGEYDSDNEVFPIPYVAKNWSLNDNSALSFVFYGRGGMNTEWDSGQFATFDPTGQGGTPSSFPGVYGGGKAGVDLMQAFLSINYSFKINDRFVLGIGPVAAAQMFKAEGLVQFTPYTKTFADTFAGLLQQGVSVPEAQQQAFAAVTSLTNTGRDTSTGYGFAAGLWTGTDALSLGLSYHSKMSMSEFDKYSDLYAQQGGFDIPSTIKAGLRSWPVMPCASTWMSSASTTATSTRCTIRSCRCSRSASRPIRRPRRLTAAWAGRMARASVGRIWTFSRSASSGPQTRTIPGASATAMVNSRFLPPRSCSTSWRRASWSST